MALAVALGAALIGCSAQEFPTSGPPGYPALNIANGTTLNVRLFVNAKDMETVPAGGSARIFSGSLPPVPWHVELKSPSGRVIIEMTVTEFDPTVINEGQEGEEDLTCGVLKIWTGYQHPGPPPVPSPTGDCSP